MSDLKQRINQILKNAKSVQNDNLAGADIEFAGAGMKKPRGKKTALKGKGVGLTGGCCNCMGMGKMPMMEYSKPQTKTSAVDMELANAIGNDSLDGNVEQNKMVERAGRGRVGGAKLKKGTHIMPNGMVMDDSEHTGEGLHQNSKMTGGKKALPQGLMKYQRNIKKLMEAGYSRKEAQAILKQMKGDGFFEDFAEGFGSVAKAVAPFVPLLL